jgi:uncharacterized membrane protein YgcG
MDPGFAKSHAKRLMTVLLMCSFTALSALAAASVDDTDGDHMPDDWETKYGLNPYDPTDGTLDSDADGFTNAYEYQAGTNPLDTTSRPPAVKRWFESFEQGIPFDAKTEPPDGQIWTASGSGTDGKVGAMSPPLAGPRFLTFSRYFEAGQISADLLVLEDLPRQEGQAYVLIDGNIVATYYSSFTVLGQEHWYHFTYALTAGPHTIEFRITGTAYSMTTVQFSLPRLLIDSIRFTSEGDSDGDGLSDIWEFEHAMNPDSTDTDNDGLPDDWEVTNALDAKTADALADTDGDGVSNLDEYRLHTDPHHKDSVPNSSDNTKPPPGGGSDSGGTGGNTGGTGGKSGGGGGGTTSIVLLAFVAIVSWRRKQLTFREM